MSPLALVYAVYGAQDAALAAARDAVERRLAACANVLAPCRSVYRWAGAVELAEEVPVLFKTPPRLREALMAHLAAGHDYAVPAILALADADAIPAFAAWADGETAPA